MTKKTEMATQEELIDAAYRYLTKPWYKKLMQFISIVGMLAAIITAFASLYVAFQGQQKAGQAVREVTELGHDLHQASVDTAQPRDHVFVYTATYFTGEREAAIRDAKNTQTKLDKAKIAFKATVYVRDDNKRWAVVIGEPTTKDEARKIINKLRKEVNLDAYPNLARRWEREKTE